MYGLILAGGSGSRLWPLSRELYPKQLFNIQNNDSLLQATFSRLLECMPAENIISITGIKHSPNVRFQLSSLAESPKILSEPIAKNTAPAIILSSKFVIDTTKCDPIILAVPSDHIINDVKSFALSVKEGEKLAEKGYIVTFGIKPTYPEIGYGYVNVANELVAGAYTVNQFVEKPDEEMEKMLKDLFHSRISGKIRLRSYC